MLLSTNPLRTPVAFFIGMFFLQTQSIYAQLAEAAQVQAQASQNNDDATLGTSNTLAPITVTASRNPQAFKNVVGDVTVINKQQLKQYSGQSVVAALRNVPNMQIVNSGGPGKVSGIYLRGTNTNQSIVLIDGIRYVSATTGAAALEHIPADQLDRIEILQGPAASIYGADAIGGVIQLFTKQSNTPNVLVSVGGGNLQTEQANITLQSGLQNNAYGKGKISFGYSHFKTDGIDAINKNNKFSYTPNYTDKDGYRNDSISLNGVQYLSDKTKVGMSGLLAANKNEYDPYSSHSKGRNGAGEIYLDHFFTQNLNGKIKLGTSIDKSTSQSVGAKSTTEYQYETRQNEVEGVLNYQQQTWFTNLVGSYAKQKVDGSTKYNKDSRDLTGISLGAGKSWLKADAQANVRYDHSDSYGGKTTFRLGGNYHVTPDWKFGAIYGTAYRIPTFNDLYYPLSGNVDLKPETSRNAELSTTYSRPTYQVKGLVYDNRIRDLIMYLYNPVSGSGSSQNIGKAHIRGASALFDGQYPVNSVQSVIYGGHIDYTHAQDVTKEPNKWLARRAKYTGIAYAGLQHSKWMGRLEAQAVGKRFDDNANLITDHGYAIGNLYGTYQLSKDFNLGLRINNLFDTKYTEVYGYNTAGINGVLSLNWAWK